MTIRVNRSFRAGWGVALVLFLGTLAVGGPLLQSSDAKPESEPGPKPIRVGVPVMQNTSGRSVNRRVQRDLLVRGFQPGKKKKGKHNDTPSIEAVALDSDSPADATREARDKNCDYVLFTDLVEMREPGDPEPRRQPGSVSLGRDPLSAYPDPTVAHDPVHYGVVEYRLQRVGDLEPRLALSVSGEEHTDEDGTVQRLLFLIVNRVQAELR